MGTAPYEQRHPAMPDPKRVVTRSVSMLRRLGLTDQSALAVVIRCACSILQQQGFDDEWPYRWVHAVADEAASRLAVLAPSPIESEGNEHADGSGS